MTDELEAELLALRATYGRELPSKAREVIDAVTRGDAAARALAHRLRGTAGAYGFPEVGNAAGALEDALERGEPEGALLEALASAASSAAGR